MDESGRWPGLAPEAARTLERHLAALRAGALPARTHELCALMIAWLNACDECLDFHAAMARRLDVDAETLKDLGDFARSERFSPAERAALAAAVALTREPRALPDPVTRKLQQHYDDAGIAELIATIAAYNAVTRLNNGLRSIAPRANA